jgi:ClpP class serine protease
MAKSPVKPVPASADAQAARGKFQQSGVFASVINELNIVQDQLIKRQDLMRRIEKALSDRYKAPNRIISYIFRFDHPKSMITSADIAPLEAVLTSISHAQELNVILHSPGGDGSIIEKIVEMCRGHLPRDNAKLRVIVPNIAKSAATVFALGADTIIMGYCSELGPIDPQIRVAVSGLRTTSRL